MNKKIFLLLLLQVCLLVSCGVLKKDKVNDTGSLNSLYQLMQGSFSSEAQAKTDSTYYNISLHMYPIWENSADKYLYVEQAIFTMQDKPYRQRIYKLIQNEDGTFSSVVYKLKDEKNFIGKWNTPAFFDSYTSDILEEREGCAVILSYLGNQVFEGETSGDACKSTLRGASYATSKVHVEPNKIISWDQGFNDADEQVWGATKAGYEFIKYE